jgi:hypothetical protein
VYKVAYALGLRFIETALLEIPKHGYFYSARHERERMQSSLEAVRVAQLLEELQVQDASCSDRQRVQQLRALALDQVQQASNDQAESGEYGTQYESRRAQTEAELRQLPSGQNDWIVCDQLLLCGDSFSRIVCPEQAEEPVDLKVSLFDEEDERYYAESRLGRAVTAPAWSPENWHGGSWGSEELTFPPFMRKSEGSMNAADPSFAITRKISTESQLERALYLSGFEVSLSRHGSVDADERTPAPTSHSEGSPSTSDRLVLDTLCDLYHEDFGALCTSGRIRISYASTYQGRIPESTNGCTVIAPLLCIHHLLDNPIPDPGLTDATIKQVIDSETPGILTQLRGELGLSAQAFLIPSDAHDYLIKNGQLAQSQFVNVLGGNILDECHIASLVGALESGMQRKLAATLFFHEHVVAILKVRREHDKFWYDVIDSLPKKKTVIRMGESTAAFHRRLALSSSLEEMEDAFLPMTARIRCLDAEALTVFLKWYACSKFSSENTSYIDQYEWDETSCDFDPRVFQAFIWSEVPQ